MSQLIARPLSREKIRNKVFIIRQLAKCTHYFDIVRFLEHVLPLLDPLFELQIVGDKELPGVYAKTYPGEHRMEVRESVYISALKGTGRDRFTLCHELGHYVLHGPNNVAYPRISGKIKKYEDPEWQANTFAAELLAPSKMTKNKDIEKIVKTFGVSREVARIQKRNSI